MDEHVRLIGSLGAIALCAIIGVYYVLVRKLHKADREVGRLVNADTVKGQG